LINFQFATADRLIFGRDTITQLPDLVKRYGQRVLIVTGTSPDRYQDITDKLQSAGNTTATYSVASEPTTHTINEGVAVARQHKAEIVIAIGGGSVIDAGKAIAAISTNQGELLTYLEVVGNGQPLKQDPLPMIAIPTTAGTGSEVTKNAVINVESHNVKVSLRDNRMIPTIALLDPILTLSVPPHITATTGIDALTQVIEPYVSRFANPLTDAICRDGIARGAQAIRQVYHHPDDIDARETMLYVSLLGGLALANAKLGAVHGFAGTLGGVTGAAHGAICGTLLPHVTEANIDALRSADDVATLQRYQEIAVWLTGDINATVDGLITWLQDLVHELQIPKLRDLGLHSDDIAKVVIQSQKSSSMKGNSITLSDSTLTAILKAAF